MTLVCDTGPLIGLAKIGTLHLLPHLTDEICIPPAVRRELLGKSGDEVAHIDRALQTFLQVVEPGPPSPPVERITALLDEGEKQAILLASQTAGDVILVVDERAGRQAASELNLRVTGLIGLLIRLKEDGQVDRVTDRLVELRRQGYWLSDEVVEIARRLAGEA